jgi:3-hydroxyacyl-[acyl-carrier-protein] dehydratase
MTLPADTEAYMPHRSPLRLVQSLLRVEDDYAEAQAILNTGDVGVGPDGRLEAAVLLEMVAQTYAAAQGYQDRDSGKPASLGYLVGASGFRIERRPLAGQQLLIRIESSCSFGDFYLVDGQVLCEGQVVARGTLKVWVQRDVGQQGTRVPCRTSPRVEAPPNAE